MVKYSPFRRLTSSGWITGVVRMLVAFGGATHRTEVMILVLGRRKLIIILPR